MATYLKAANNNDLRTTVSWTTAVIPTSLDEGTWNSASGTSPTLGSAWSVGKLSLGANVAANVRLGAASTPNAITLIGIANVVIDNSANNLNRELRFSGPITLGSGGVGDVSIVSGTSTAAVVTEAAITKSSGIVTISGSGAFTPTASSTATWTGGSILLETSTIFIGVGAGTSPTASGVLGANTVILKIGSGNPTVATGNSASGRLVNNPLEINGSFVLGTSTAGGLQTRIDGAVTVNPGTHTITVPVSGGLAYAGTVVPFSGTGNIVKAGAGSLSLGIATIPGASATWSGTFSATAGTVVFANTKTLQDAIFNTTGANSTWTLSSLPASSFIGGLSGNANLALTTAVTLGGNAQNVSATWTGGFITNNIIITKQRTGTQQLGGSSTGRTNAKTDINEGAIQLNSSGGLYAGASPSGITTAASGAGLWLSGGISTPSGAGIQINGTGVTLDGAIRNIAGNNTVGSTITLGSSATIKNAVSASTLTLKALTLGTANNLTLDSGSGATIQMDAAATGTGTSELIITGAGSTTTATTGVLAAAVNRINGTFNSSNTQSIASTKVLDGVGTITGAGALSMASGSTLRAGNGAGDGTLTVANLTFASGTETFQTYKNGGAVSKVAVVGALTHTGTVTVNASSSSWVSGSTHTFLTYGSRSGAGTFTAGTLTGATVRQSISIDAAGLTAQTFTIAGNGNTSVTWAGGIAGDWYDNEATGWSGTGVTDFKNGDTVTFDATSSAAATLTGNVSVASLTMNAAAHTIGGSYTLTNAGALTLSGAFKQTLNVAGTHGAVSIGAGSTLELGNAGALGGTGAITLNGASAKLSFASGADGLSTTRALTLTANDSFLETSGNAIAAITGAVSGGQSTVFLTKIGSGLVALTGTVSTSTVFRIGQSGLGGTPGANVLRLGSTSPSTAMRLNNTGILELTSAFSRAYGNAANQIYVEDTTGVGAGFSSFNVLGNTISTAINFGTSNPTTQWNGPLYFGSALGTATGKVTMTGTLALVTGNTSQTFHVFNGATTAASAARINTLNNNNSSGNSTFVKAGPGALYLVSGVNGGTSTSTVRVSEGALEVGSTTTNVVTSIEIPSGATNAVVRHEASAAAAVCSAFSPAPAANFTLEAASSLGTFSVSNALDIGSRTVTLSGSETGVKSSTSGTGTGKYVKTGIGTWSLGYAYASRAAGFSGGADVDEGTLKVTQKFGLGSGPIAVAAGAKLQFTDTTTDPAIIGSIASLSTTGSTARLIIGA